MKNRHRRHTAAAILLVAAGIHLAAGARPDAPQAGAVWRCGNTYGDQPCTGGRSVDVDDTRSAGQQRAGEAHARDAQRQADAMARERRRLEAQAAGQGPAVIAPPPKPEPASAQAGWHKPRKPGKASGAAPFAARDPSAPAGKKRRKKKTED